VKSAIDMKSLIPDTKNSYQREGYNHLVRSQIGHILARADRPLSLEEIQHKLGELDLSCSIRSLRIMVTRHCGRLWFEALPKRFILNRPYYDFINEVQEHWQKQKEERQAEKLKRKDQQCKQPSDPELDQELKELSICRRQMEALRLYLRNPLPEVLQSLPEGYGPAETSQPSCLR
jgi:hypothetical protein